jgi:hypothetical protein
LNTNRRRRGFGSELAAAAVSEFLAAVMLMSIDETHCFKAAGVRAAGEVDFSD